MENENSPWKFIAIGSIIVLAIVAVIFAYLYFSSTKAEEVIWIEKDSSIESVEKPVTVEPSVQPKPTIKDPLESDGFSADRSAWIKFSDFDPDFGYQTSIYLPPENYDFKFTGKQWYLGYVAEPKEFWDYRASFSNDRRDKSIGITNKYDGTAPEDWYIKFMNNEHPWMGSSDVGNYEYLSVKEVKIGDKTYLDTQLIDTSSKESEPLRTFLYVQNGILHMFTDFDGLENGGNLESVIDKVLYSLESR